MTKDIWKQLCRHRVSSPSAGQLDEWETNLFSIIPAESKGRKRINDWLIEEKLEAAWLFLEIGYSILFQFLFSQFNCTLPPIFHKKRMNSSHWKPDSGIWTIWCESNMVNASLYCQNNIKGLQQDTTPIFPCSTGYVSPPPCWKQKYNFEAFFLSNTIYEIITTIWAPIANLLITASLIIY